MRPLLISVVLVAIYLFGATYLYSEIEKTSVAFSEELLEIQNLVKEDNWEESKELFNAFKKRWQPTSTLWMTYIGHHDIDSVEEAIRETDVYLKVEDVAGTLENLSKLTYHLEHIYEKEKINWYNIL